MTASDNSRIITASGFNQLFVGHVTPVGDPIAGLLQRRQAREIGSAHSKPFRNMLSAFDGYRRRPTARGLQLEHAAFRTVFYSSRPLSDRDRALARRR